MAKLVTVEGYPTAKVTRGKEKVEGIKQNDQITEALGRVAEWFEIDREAKQEYMSELAEMYKLYKGDHWDLLGPDGVVLRNPVEKKNRPNVVENISQAMVEGLIAEFGQDIEIVDYPMEQHDQETAKLMTNLKKYIMYKNKFQDEYTKWLRWFFTYGTGIWHPHWDPNWSGGKGPNRWVGDVRLKALHPAMLFPDARCKDDINEGYRCHKALWRPLEYIRESYPEHGHLVGEESLSDFDLEVSRDIDEDGERHSVGDKQGQALLIETWYRGRPMILKDGEKDEGTGLHVIWWAGEGQEIYLHHENYVYYDPDTTPRFPFIVRQCYPREGSPWGFGELYYLRNPQIVQNKSVEIVLEGHMQQAVGQTFYQPQGMSKAQLDFLEANGQIPGAWFPVNDVTAIKREYGRGVPASLLSDVERRVRSMESIVGRHDISQGRTPGSVTAFRALNLLASRAASRLRTKEVAIRTALEDSGNEMNRLIAEFYNERRAFRILGSGQQDPAVYGVFQPEKIRNVWIPEPFNETLPAEGWEPEEGMQEGEDYEVYCPEYDCKCFITQAMPTDRMFYMELVKELYAMQLVPPDVLWHVMDQGRFPPWEQVAQAMEQLFAMRQAQAMMQSGVMPGPGAGPGPGGGAGNIEAAIANLPVDLQEQLMNMEPSARNDALQQYLAEMEAQQ